MLNDIFNPSNYFFNPYAVPSIIVGIYCFALGIFVWAKNKKLLGFSLFTLTFPCGVWLMSVGMGGLSKNPELAHTWYKLCYFWVPFISVGSFFFALHISNMVGIKKEQIFLISGYIIMPLFSLSALFTDWLVKFPPYTYYWGFEGRAGKFLFIFVCLWASWALKAGYNVYLAYKKATTALEKQKMRIFLHTYIFGYISIIDFAGDFGIGIYPFGYLFTGTYISLLAYNMIKYKAFEVETVVHKTLLWIISIATLVIPIGVVTAFISRFFLVKLNIYLEIAIFIIFFLSFYYYYAVLRPRIDHIFRRKKFDYLQILGKVTQEISGIIDLEELTRKTVLSIKETIYPQTIHLFLMDEKRKGYYLKSRIKEHYASFSKEDCPLFIPETTEMLSLLREAKQPLEKELVSLDPTYKEVKEEAEDLFNRTESVILFGLFMEEELIGLLFLGRRENLLPYRHLDIVAINNLALDVGNFFFTSLHHQDILERQRLQQEITLAKHIQENLLPQKSPEISGLSLYGLYVPSREIGGDYYDFIFPDKEEKEGKDKRLYITIGDVSGKGMDAGLVMAILKTSLFNLSETFVSPLDILLKLNNFLYQQVKQQKFVSLLLLNYTSSNPNTITYSSAGHERILIYRREPATKNAPEIEVIKSGGMILGMLDKMEPLLEENSLKLNQGDKILLYTDGVTEARNPEEKLFGLEGLIASFKKHADLPIEEMVKTIHTEIKDFISTRDQYDDITLVGIEKE